MTLSGCTEYVESSKPIMEPEGNVLDTRSHTPSCVLPADILRPIFEEISDPGTQMSISLADDRDRLKAAYELCLINKSVTSWIEPLLYRMVVLESDLQIASFVYAFEMKGQDFLSKHVRALWILDCDGKDSDGPSTFDLGHLLRTLGNLEKLCLPGNWFTSLSMLNSPSTIRELTLTRPWRSFDDLDLRHLPLQSLHVIDPHLYTLNSRLFSTKDWSDHISRRHFEETRLHFERIPRMCFDFTQSPSNPCQFVYKLAMLLKKYEELRSKLETTEIHPTGLSLWFKYYPHDLYYLMHGNIRASRLEQLEWIRGFEAYKLVGPSHRLFSRSKLRIDDCNLEQTGEKTYTQIVKEEIRYNEIHWFSVTRKV